MKNQSFILKILGFLICILQISLSQEETEKKKEQQQDDDDENSTVVYILLAILGGGFLFFLYNTWRCHRNKQIEEDEQEFNRIEFQDQKEP